MNIKTVKLKDISVQSCPLRKAADEMRMQLIKSVKDNGILRLPHVNARTGHVIDGILLISIIKMLYIEECQIIFHDVSEEEELEMRIILNCHSRDWVWEELSKVLKRMKTPPADTGLREMEYAPLLAAEWKAPEYVAAQTEIKF